MEEEEVLNKLHSLQLLLADEVKRICEKYNIKYFMIAGTLLGAVRHKGFIPWDDDMDFGMPREGFERFLKVCKKELNPDIFRLQTDRKEKYYTFNYAKLSLKGTKIIDGFTQSVDIHHGIYIDIFPIDVVPDNPIARWIQSHAFYIAHNLLWVKCGYGTESQRESMKYKVAVIISKLFSIEFLKKIKRKIVERYDNKDSKYVVVSEGAYGFKKETLNRCWTKDTREYFFEDRIYPGIKNYNAYLTYFYGDYMKIPSVDQRNHHERISIDFGKY